MEYIPEQWTSLRRKAGADAVPSLLDLVWDPGYQLAYEDFLDRVQSRMHGYTAGAGELLYAPQASPYMRTWAGGLSFPVSVWGTAKNLRKQVRLAFQETINNAISSGLSQAAMEAKLEMTWTLLEGSRWSEIDSRLRALSHTAMGWYKSFARRYFMILAPITVALFQIWKHIALPFMRNMMRAGANVFRYYMPGTANWLATNIALPVSRARTGWIHPMLGEPFVNPVVANLRMSWFGLKHVPGVVVKFARTIKDLWTKPVGIVPGSGAMTALLAVGMPGPGIVAGIVLFLLMTLLPSYEVQAPTFTEEELDAIYGNPDLQPLREEVAQIAVNVHEIENSLAGLEQTFESEKGFSERVMSEGEPSITVKAFSEQALAMTNDISRLRLSVNDEALAPVREALLARVEKMRTEPLEAATGPGTTYETMMAREEQVISDEVLEAYFNVGEILDLLAPSLEQFAGGKDPDTMTDEEVIELIKNAAERNPGILEQHAQAAAQRIVKEQEVIPATPPNTMALEAALEAGLRLENLVNMQVREPSEYSLVISQLTGARKHLEPEDIQLANEMIAATEEVMGALA